MPRTEVLGHATFGELCHSNAFLFNPNSQLRQSHACPMQFENFNLEVEHIDSNLKLCVLLQSKMYIGI